MIYELVKSNDKILRTKLSKFDFSSTSEINSIDLTRNLAETMHHYNGIGLAANQVGLFHNLFVIKADPIMAFFNAVIVDFSSELVEMDEGCLSFPGLILKIKRPKTIKIRYALPSSEIVTEKYTGMTARCILHEIDHINGICFIDKVSKLKLEMAKKKALKK